MPVMQQDLVEACVTVRYSIRNTTPSLPPISWEGLPRGNCRSDTLPTASLDHAQVFNRIYLFHLGQGLSCFLSSSSDQDVSLPVCQRQAVQGITCRRGSRQCPGHWGIQGCTAGSPYSVSAWSSPRLNLFGLAVGWRRHPGSMHQNLYAICFIVFQLLKTFKYFWFCFSEAWGRQYLKISLCLTTIEKFQKIPFIWGLPSCLFHMQL